MNSYFSNTARRTTLANEADKWLGTPFMPNGCIKGSGVSCQKLVGAIYIATGVWPADHAIPDWPADFGDPKISEEIISFMNREVEEGRFEEVLDSVLVPGDLIGLRIKKHLMHLGIVVNSAGNFIHCLREPAPGVMFSGLRDATYLSRIEKIWRPLDV